MMSRRILPEPAILPTRISFFMSYHCNLRCKFCITHKYRRLQKKIPDMNSDIVYRALEAFGPFSRAMVGAPGEPMASPNFPDVIKTLAHRVGLLSITTNGTLTLRIKDQVPWNRIHRVNLSFPEVEPDRYEKITGKRLLGKAIWALKFFRNNPNVTVVPHFVVGAGNVHRIEDYVRFVLDHGVRNMVIQPLMNYKDFVKDEVFFWKHSLTRENRKAMDAFYQQQHIANELIKGTRMNIVWPSIVSKRRPGRGCNMVLNYIAVNGSGDVAICCRGEGPRAELGNLRDGKELWRSPVLDEFRRRVFTIDERFPKCKVCHAAYERGDVDIHSLKKEEQCP